MAEHYTRDVKQGRMEVHAAVEYAAHKHACVGNWKDRDEIIPNTPEMCDSVTKDGEHWNTSWNCARILASCTDAGGVEDGASTEVCPDDVVGRSGSE